MTGPSDRTRAADADAPGWYSTFTLLDYSCAIDSRQYRRLLASIAQVWRRLTGRPL